MKIVLQRVKQASVKVQNRTAGTIGQGVCLFVGVEKGDSEEEARYLAHKIVELRIFPDEKGKMNLSLLDVQGEVLSVSQFTLAGSLKKGRRPSFDNAESPEKAEALFLYFVSLIKQKGLKVETGVFGALMEVYLVNDGPVTFILEKKK
ncbi:MAG: D-aminoacyl-tRNA deacylase [Candidatus Aminicenantes bacterium]